MKTIKGRILDFLQGKEWVDKQQICSEIYYLTGSYTDTVARKLRELVADNQIIKREYENKRGTEYRRKNLHEIAHQLKKEQDINLTLL